MCNLYDFYDILPIWKVNTKSQLILNEPLNGNSNNNNLVFNINQFSYSKKTETLMY